MEARLAIAAAERLIDADDLPEAALAGDLIDVRGLRGWTAPNGARLRSAPPLSAPRPHSLTGRGAPALVVSVLKSADTAGVPLLRIAPPVISRARVYQPDPFRLFPLVQQLLLSCVGGGHQV